MTSVDITLWLSDGFTFRMQSDGSILTIEDGAHRSLVTIYPGSPIALRRLAEACTDAADKLEAKLAVSANQPTEDDHGA